MLPPSGQNELQHFKRVERHLGSRSAIPAESKYLSTGVCN